jgi:hypothetical protein
VLLLLPVLTFVLVCARLRLARYDWRTAALGASVIWGVYLTILTELLSVVHLVTLTYVALGWTLASVVCLGLLVRTRSRRPSSAGEEAHSFKLPDRATGGLLLGVVVLAATVGVTALVAPPNTWDVMEYHLPRVVEWMTYHSVQFFPTNDYTQLIFSPWAEYGMLHLYLLNGSDQFVNFIEVFSYLGTIIGVSLIAQQLGASAWGQVLATVLAATLPELLLEASGSMNTAVMGFWLVACVTFLIAWTKQPTWFMGFAAASAAGLAVLTKGSAYAFIPPIALACWWFGSARSRKLLLLAGPAFVVVALSLNAPQYVRNFQLNGQPLGLPFPEAGSRLAWGNEHVTVSGTISNALRNAALQVATPSLRVNRATVSAVSWAIRAIGGDPDDPATTWADTIWWKGFQLPNDQRHEAFAGNPLHFFLLLVIGVALALDRGKRLPGALTLLLGLVGAFILYGVMLRWQVWGSRHFIPLLVLGAAVTGTAVGRMPKAVGIVLTSILLLVGLSVAVENELRPLAPWPAPSIFQQSRQELYFADQHSELASSWISAANVVKASSCADIAIDTADGYWMYPMVALINDDGRQRAIRFGGVSNRTVAYEDGSIRSACGVVCIYCASLPDKKTEYERPGWKMTAIGDVLVFLSDRQQT